MVTKTARPPRNTATARPDSSSGKVKKKVGSTRNAGQGADNGMDALPNVPSRASSSFAYVLCLCVFVVGPSYPHALCLCVLDDAHAISTNTCSISRSM